MSSLTPLAGNLKNRSLRRFVTICLAVSCTAGALYYILLFRLGHFAPQRNGTPPPPLTIDPLWSDHGQTFTQTCSIDDNIKSAELWRAIQRKYDSLPDDKFTVAIQTYRRPRELNKTLDILLDNRIPSLSAIHVIWNDVDTQPPADFISSPNGIPVTYRRSRHNSLNEKLRPDPSYGTQAVFLSDDDVSYRAGDLEFAFQTWREHGRDRLVGAMPRCSDRGSGSAGANTKIMGDTWTYSFCTNEPYRDSYSMIITNLAFSHVALLDYYWSDQDDTATALRSYVDQHFNCEDIAFNFIASYLTRKGPLHVAGHESFANAKPKDGISRQKGHMMARSRCLNDFANLFGCMPLRNVTGYMQRGVNVIH